MTIASILKDMTYGVAPESKQIALDWLEEKNIFEHFIGGIWTSSAASFVTENPATGEALARVALAGVAEVDAAVGAAQAALPEWTKLGDHGRAKYLYALARGLQKHARLFAVLETLDNGKTIRESRDVDIPLAIRHFYHHVGWAQLRGNEFPDYQALGVVGQIVPWNFPLLMLAWKVAPALACGNTVVLKSAEDTPLTALLFAQLCAEVGLPPGVFNLVNGDAETGKAIVRHPGIAKIAFTGSTAVGRWIRSETAGTDKKLSLELGGKSPFIVFADADLDSAVEGLVDSIWFNQGQVCCAGSRLLVAESVADVFLNKLRRRMERIRVGDPLDKSVDMGPLVSRAQLELVSGYIRRAKDEGGEVWQPATGNALPATGHYCAPCLITNVSAVSTVVQDEIFGPVLTVMTFRTHIEAVQLANNTIYGLAASVWSESISLALEVVPKIKAGVIWVNGANMFDASCGFGGYKESGYGREGGIEGLREYLTRKPNVKKSSSKKQGAIQSLEFVGSRGDVDHTVKLYIGGKQVRPDGGYSLRVMRNGKQLAVVPVGQRKDIRNAVEAANQAASWGEKSGHERAQILYYMAENLGQQRHAFEQVLRSISSPREATREVNLAIDRLFTFAAWADKHEGRVHFPPMRGMVTALNEPVGNIGVVCPTQSPLLALITLMGGAMSQGNRLILIPSSLAPHVMGALTQLLETSDVPAGVVNVVTGDVNELANTLAGHADVQAIWRLDGSDAGCKEAEQLSAKTLKRTWMLSHADASQLDWAQLEAGDFRALLLRAVEVKNVWIPYGV